MDGFVLFAFLTFVFLINLPFGHWRAASRKFSLQWFAAIHLPVFMIILLRLRLGGAWTLIPFTVGLSVLGQFLGGRIR
ncbi:MAG: hypothetical protein HYU64_03620 [Armatimonadetes bacterium]|nr:hypothetical protein [Armatimonadota bacterium]